MTTVHIPCDSCGDLVTASREHLSPVTLCGACTPEEYADMLLALDEEVPEPIDHTLPGLLEHPCMPVSDGDDDRLLGLYIGNAQTWDDLLTEEMRVSPDELADLESLPANAALDPAVASELRARIRRRAA